MPYREDELRPISALQHLRFCPRQCALIHLEQVWEENRLTAEGRVLHEKAHEPRHETRAGVRTTRSLPLRSFALGLSGVADIVEFHPDGTLVPVEYKRGKPKADGCDAIQLCAQALCLEEMLGRPVPAGALFYGQTRRRQDIVFDASLRDETVAVARELHALLAAGVTPHAVRAPKCDACSLLNLCLPDALRHRRDTRAWFEQALNAPAGPTDTAL
ncbi:MAG: CRISPR-associated protein Cas4 [Verrucomicrobiota bacterium]